jgi:hypothetical protein
VGGDWEITLQTPQGANTVNLALKQDGDKVTGNLSSPMGAVPVTGSLASGAVVLTASIDIQGSSLQLGLNGKLDGDTMNGTVKFGDFGEFPFTGKRGAKVETPSATAEVPPISAPSTSAQPASGPAGGPVDASGKWDVVLTIAGVGEFPASATLKQEGDKVTGVLSNMAGVVPVAGTMTGNSLRVEFTAKTPQGDVPVILTGELGASGLFTGKASLAGMGEADWTGKRSVQ